MAFIPNVLSPVFRSPCQTPLWRVDGRPRTDRNLAVAERRNSAAHANEDDLVFPLVQMNLDFGAWRQVLGHHRHANAWRQL